MEIIWYGQSCFKIKGKSATVITDPFDSDASGLKLPKDLTADLVLSSHSHSDHNNTQAVLGDPLVVAGPGEYEVKGVSVIGVSTFHDNQNGSERGSNTVYNIMIDGVNIVHLGDLGHQLSEDQVEGIDQTDILLVPVGGVYTVGTEDISKVISQLEPRVIIPMHYKIEGLKYELGDVNPFLQQMGAEGVESVPKLSITKDKLPDETQVVVLSKS